MAYWLLKTEPDKYAYADLARDGTTVWDEVTNALALKHIRTMVPGDLALIYHTGKERQITGVAEIVSQPYPDPSLNEDFHKFRRRLGSHCVGRVSRLEASGV